MARKGAACRGGVTPLLLLLQLLLPCFLLVAPASAVKGPPVRMKHVSPHLIARLRGSVRLNCPVEGTPQPMLEWRKDGAQVLPGWERFSLDGNTLHVTRVTADDAGVYVCVAVNGFGTERVTTELFVIDPKTSGFSDVSGGKGPADNLLTSRNSPPLIRSPPAGADRLVRAALGSRLQLSCVADGYPEPEVKWYKADRPVLPSTRLYAQDSGQLVFTQLVRSDEGVFICVASNIFGSANHSFSLRVSEPLSPDPVFLDTPNNSTVYEGETVVLRCRVQSVSKAHLKWVRRLVAGASAAFNQTQTVVIKGLRYAVIAGTPTAQDGDQYFTQLTLPTVTTSQEGVYSCMAANDNGYVGREAFLQVATAPPSSMQALLIALPAVALVVIILGAICCLHRRRKTLPPPATGDRQTKQQVLHAPPAAGRPEYFSQRYPDDGDRALRTVLMPPVRPSADGASVSRNYEVPPPPASYDYRQFRHLDVV